MTDITIPAAALEAGARAKYENDCAAATSEFSFPPWEDVPKQIKEWCLEDQRIAILAALNAWPGVNTESREILKFGNNIDGPIVSAKRAPFLILPLPPPPALGEPEHE